eukprot:TRINITY_DN36470_c0_g2_i2.p1 TRINITY_DN36470_c0_g2~~TRINITY_DN36470_c0_g2_i2.p1  ORF type:complete len:1590 (+),score=401.12 TRINITY_DN36470_c0_g2_i2:164-4933(+)
MNAAVQEKKLENARTERETNGMAHEDSLAWAIRNVEMRLRVIKNYRKRVQQNEREAKEADLASKPIEEGFSFNMGSLKEFFQWKTSANLLTSFQHLSAVADCTSFDDQVMFTTNDNNIRQWDLAKHFTLKVLTGHEKGVKSLDVYNYTNRTLLASGAADGRIKLWNYRTNLAPTTIQAHRGGVMYVKFSAHGEMVASVGCDNKLKMWSVKTGKMIWEMNPHEDIMGKPCFSSDGLQVATCGGYESRCIKVWSAFADKKTLNPPDSSDDEETKAKKKQERIAEVAATVQDAFQEAGRRFRRKSQTGSLWRQPPPEDLIPYLQQIRAEEIGMLTGAEPELDDTKVLPRAPSSSSIVSHISGESTRSIKSSKMTIAQAYKKARALERQRSNRRSRTPPDSPPLSPLSPYKSPRVARRRSRNRLVQSRSVGALDSNLKGRHATNKRNNLKNDLHTMSDFGGDYEDDYRMRRREPNVGKSFRTTINKMGSSPNSSEFSDSKPIVSAVRCSSGVLSIKSPQSAIMGSSPTGNHSTIQDVFRTKDKVFVSDMDMSSDMDDEDDDDDDEQVIEDDLRKQGTGQFGAFISEKQHQMLQSEIHTGSINSDEEFDALHMSPIKHKKATKPQSKLRTTSNKADKVQEKDSSPIIRPIPIKVSKSMRNFPSPTKKGFGSFTTSDVPRKSVNSQGSVSDFVNMIKAEQAEIKQRSPMSLHSNSPPSGRIKPMKDILSMDGISGSKHTLDTRNRLELIASEVNHEVGGGRRSRTVTSNVFPLQVPAGSGQNANKPQPVENSYHNSSKNPSSHSNSKKRRSITFGGVGRGRSSNSEKGDDRMGSIFSDYQSMLESCRRESITASRRRRRSVRRTSTIPFGSEIMTIPRKSDIKHGHTNAISAVAYTNDSAMIASASHDGTIKFWSSKNGKYIRTLSGHEGPVLCISFSPLPPMMVSGSADRTIGLWDINTGELLKRLRGHCDIVNSISYTQTHHRIISASQDLTVKLWQVTKLVPFPPGAIEARKMKTDITLPDWEIPFSSSFRLVWEKTLNGCEVHGHKIMWRCFFISKCDPIKTWNEIETGPEDSMEVTRLRPGTRYTFKIAGFNSLGLGPFCPEVSFLRTPPGIPRAPVDAIVVRSSASTLSMRFKCPEPMGSPISHFVVQTRGGQSEGTSWVDAGTFDWDTCVALGRELRNASLFDEKPKVLPLPKFIKPVIKMIPIEDDADDEDEGIPDIVPLKKKKHPTRRRPLACRVSGLSPGQTYVIRVAAINAVGRGAFSDGSISARTASSVPAKMAKPGLKLSKDSAHAVTITWRAPHNHGSGLSRFKIRCSNIKPFVYGFGALGETAFDRIQDDGEENEPNDMIGHESVYKEDYVAGRSVQYEFGGLKPGAEYVFQMAAENSNGWAPWSAPVSMTMECCEPGQPPPPVLSAPDITSISVIWQPPEENGGVEITSYIFKMRNDDTVVFGNEIMVPMEDSLVLPDGSRRLHCRVSGLQAATQFQFCVGAMNSKGLSEFSRPSAFVQTLGPQKPDPVRNFRVDFMIPGEIHLRWSTPRANGAPITAYKILHVDRRNRIRNETRDYNLTAEFRVKLKECQVNKSGKLF